MAIERRLTELSAPSAASCTPRARATTRSPPTWRCSCARTRSTRSRVLAELMGTLVELAEAHLDWPMPGYTHLQRAQPVYLSHHLLAYFWMFRRDAAALRLLHGRDRRPAARRGRAGGRQLRHRPRCSSPRSSASARSPRTRIDAVSNRDFVLDYLSAAATCATHLSRLGRRDRAVVERGVRLLRARRRLRVGLEHHAAEEEPRRRRAAAREGAARRRPPDGAARRDARPAADLQQGPAGGQGAPLRRGRHARAVPARRRAGCSRASRFDRERLAAAATDEMLAATDVADLLVKRGVPFREAHGIVAGLVRARGRPGRRALRADREELAELAPDARRRVLRGARRARLARVEGLRGRHVARARARAARPARARAARRPASLSATATAGGFYDAAGARGRARPDRLRRPPRRHRRADRRDRGLPRVRAGLPRLRRADAAHARPVRPARAAPTSTAPTASTRC